MLGIRRAALDRWSTCARQSVRLADDETSELGSEDSAWATVKQLVRLGQVSDLAIDSLARFAPGDSNSEEVQAGIFEALAGVIDSAPLGRRPTVWVLLHKRKGTGRGVDEISGSAQRAAQADSILVVTGKHVNGRHVSSTVTFPKLRHDPDNEPMPTTYAIVKGPDGSRALRYGPHDGQAQPGKPSVLEDRLQKVLDALANEDEGMSGNALAKAAGVKKIDVHQLAKELIKQALVEDTGSATRPMYTITDEGLKLANLETSQS